MTRKIILYIATSIDGYIADKDGKIDWLINQGEVEEIGNYNVLYNRIDTVVLGKKTYDQVVNELSIDSYPYEDKLSYILTSKSIESSSNKIFINENIVDLITRLKKENGKDIWIIGGASIITPLIEANLIDEYQITTIPIILGNGISLFQPTTTQLNLKIANISLENNMIFSNYYK